MNEVTTIKIENARLAFPAIYEPKPFKPGMPPKYHADLVITPDNPSWAKFLERATRLAGDKFGDIAEGVMTNIQQDKRLRCFRSGSEKLSQKTMKVYEGYEGMKYVHGINDEQPALFNGAGEVIDPTDALGDPTKFYGGCYVNAIVSPWIQDNQYGRAIRCNLLALQFRGDGAKFSAKPVMGVGTFDAVEGAEVPASSATSFM